MKIKILIFTISLVLPSLLIGSQQKYSNDYSIGARDILDISVFGHGELSRTVRVSENGKITFPPILGEIKVEGLTKIEVEQELSRRLAERYIKTPRVTVFIRDYQSKKISVLGAVESPGTYDLIGYQTLLQIITQAGGFNDSAGEEIIVMRLKPDRSYSTLKILKIDLLMGNTELNIPLQANDIINIPADETVRIFIFGQVASPGAIEVRKSKIPTLLQLIIQAGGFSDRASKGGVMVKRVDDKGNEEIIKVNVKDIIKGKRKDFQLKANDVIHVTQTLF